MVELLCHLRNQQSQGPIMSNQESKTVSLKIDFDIEGVQFTESIIETLKANVEHAITRCISEGMLTDNNQDNVSVSLKNVSPFSPCVTVFLDTVCIENILTNSEDINVNVISDADVPEEENIFQLDGYEHHLGDKGMVSCKKDDSDKCVQAAKAVRVMQEEEGAFVDINKADLIHSDAQMMVRPAFYTESKAGTTNTVASRMKLLKGRSKFILMRANMRQQSIASYPNRKPTLLSKCGQRCEPGFKPKTITKRGHIIFNMEKWTQQITKLSGKNTEPLTGGFGR